MIFSILGLKHGVIDDLYDCKRNLQLKREAIDALLLEANNFMKVGAIDDLQNVKEIPG